MLNSAQRWARVLLTVVAIGITDASFVLRAQQYSPRSNIIIVGPYILLMSVGTAILQVPYASEDECKRHEWVEMIKSPSHLESKFATL
jgi:hypothetical protein